MKRINLKLLFIASAFFLLTSCSSFKEVKTSSLKIGMSKNDVQQVTKKRGSAIASKKLPGSDQVVEVLRFDGFVGSAYWLYFVDGHLDRWEQVNEIGPAI